MKSYDKVFVLDTNVILNNPDSVKILSNSGECLVVVPEIVLAELDQFKGLMDGKGYATRTFSNFLKNAVTTVKQDTAVMDKVPLEVYQVFNIVDEIKVVTVGINPYPSRSDALNLDKIYMDFLIIYTAKVVSQLYQGLQVVLITDDMNCRNMALTKGINAEPMITSKKKDFPAHFVSVQSDESWRYKNIEEMYGIM